MAYVHVYSSRINWENEPSIVSPINATNLNKMDYALKAMDDTFATWDITKADQSDLLLALKDVTYDTDTGEFVFTWWNGTTKTVDLNIEKIPVSFSMDEYGVITMTTEDGSTYTADVGALIKTYTFSDSSEIDFDVVTDASGNKTVTAGIKAGSIDGTKLVPNYLADCEAAAYAAENAADDAELSVGDAEAWAVGTRGGVPVPVSDPTYNNNAEYWAKHTSAAFAGLTDTDINNPQNGQVPIFNSTTQKWENGQAAAGGGSTVRVTTAESVLYGQTVTLTDGVTTLSATFDSLGVATFSGVTITGSVTISATAGGQTFTTNITIPYFGNYDAVLSGFTAYITVTFPGSCTVNGQTSTSSPHTFTVNAAGTYPIAVTVDGVTKTDSATITSDGETVSKTVEFGTINLTYSDEFRGSTITCVNGGTTITKTAPSAGNTMVFYPPTTGSWTISGTYGGDPYSTSVTITSLSTPESASLQTLVDVTVTMYSATEDTVTFTDASGIQKIEVFASGQSSKSVTIKIDPAGSSITFTSSVAKDPDNLSNDYSKTITITSATTDVKVMPDGALYWWGYENPNFADCSTDGWTGSTTYSAIQSDTHRIYLYPAGNPTYCAVASKGKITGTVKAICEGLTARSGIYGYLFYDATKDMRNSTDAQITTNSMQMVQLSVNNAYCGMRTYGNSDSRGSIYMYALWYE